MIYWLASYPKSGNTWVRMLVRHYARLSGDNVDAQHGDTGRYWYQTVSPVPVDELSLAEQAQMRGAAMAHLQCFVTCPTLVKTHHCCGRINGVPLFASQWTTGIVYVVRDPRDVVASLANHMGHETLDEAIHYMAQESAIIAEEDRPAHHISSWSGHVESWTEVQQIAEPLVVRYEDLHADTAGELARIVEHMGVEEPNSDAIERAVELCRIDRLKEREDEIAFPETSPKADRFFRKGEVGGHKDELTAEQIAKVEAQFGDCMERLGYEPSHQAATAA